MEERKIEIILGTNEEFVLGYQLYVAKDGKVFLDQTFADHAHIGSVRQVAVGGKYLVSGGTDEHIKVYDLHEHKEVGSLLEHEGTITYLGFYGNKYLFSAGEDGKICIFNCRGWQCEKTLKGHKSGVVSVSVHPSGKLGLSLGRDRKLRTWNLIKGRKAYITHIDSIADLVQWSPTAENFVIVKGSSVDLYDVVTGKVKSTVNFKERVNALIFITDDIIAVAVGDKNIGFYDVANQFEILQWEAHNMRVKSLCLVPRVDAEEPWLVSAASDGFVKIWKLQLLSLMMKPELLGKVDTTCRIICMDVFVPSPPSKKDQVESIVQKEKATAKREKSVVRKGKSIMKGEESIGKKEKLAVKKGMSIMKKKKSIVTKGKIKSIVKKGKLTVDEGESTEAKENENEFALNGKSVSSKKEKVKKKRTKINISADDNVPKKKKLKKNV